MVFMRSSLLFLICLSLVNADIVERGDDNMPSQNNGETDELTYPYLNVHYHFNKSDWNRILEDQQKLIALRRRVNEVKRRIKDDAKRAENFMRLQDGLLIDARSALFERALFNTTHPHGDKKFKRTPASVHDRLHVANEEFYTPIPTSDFVNINEPYYYHMLADQWS
ncbi:hypothetical protein BgAZ_200540 [Babesia gibsoni]|uniref:Uncharacterized protein n=1 Tax=Babesia gibsoni TaxID=33632 RepID=A0AAD8PDA7_BABGI|nr:hypothetical protein BgAZ_200540 [Babesia gibsoni]